MNIIKRMVLFAASCFIILTFTFFSVKAETLSGECGTDVNWILNTNTGQLNIFGTGKITSTPWNSYKSSIKYIIVSDGVTAIGNSAFSNCINLVSVDMGNTIKNIGNYSFAGCTSLNDVKFSDSLTKIGACAFDNCISITEIELPDTVKTIDGGAFGYCSALANLKLSADLSVIGNYAFSGCSGLRMVDLPDKVSIVGNYVFSGCYALEMLDLNDGITTIGSNAFEFCESLKSVIIPSTVVSLGDQAFNACKSLESITVSEENLNYSSDANGVLYNHDFTCLIKYPAACDLKEYKIDYRVSEIADWAFYQANNINILYFGKTISKIGYAAFYENAQLTDVYFDGRSDEFEKVVMEGHNDSLDIAKIHYIDEMKQGDINDDGIINVKDITLLRRFIVGGYGLILNQYVADINNDGQINVKDVTMLRKCIADGYDVKIK